MISVAETSGVSLALKTSLENWAKQNTTYKDLFKTLRKEVLQVAYDAFEEMPRPAPGVYDFWWAQSHNRYIKSIKQRELLLLHEIMYNFLTAFARGQVSYASTTTTKKSKAKA